jgi:DNA-binding CsgD family transcriptional regulator
MPRHTWPRNDRPSRRRSSFGRPRKTVLTPLEFEVLQLMACGYTAWDIHRMVEVSAPRLQEIKRHIREKLGLGTGADTNTIVAKARDLGYIRNN